MNLIKKKINSWALLQKLNCNIVYPKNTKELKDNKTMKKTLKELLHFIKQIIKNVKTLTKNERGTR